MRQRTERLEKRIKSRHLNMPGGIAREFESLKAGDPRAIEMAVRFLEAAPWYFRAGYHPRAKRVARLPQYLTGTGTSTVARNCVTLPATYALQ